MESLLKPSSAERGIGNRYSPAEVPAMRITDDLPSVDTPIVPEYRAPRSLDPNNEFTWNDDNDAVENYESFGTDLAKAGDLFRNTTHGSGLMQAPLVSTDTVRPVMTPAALASAIADRVRVKVTRNGKPHGSMISSAHLRTMLTSESFLQQFPPVDAVTEVPLYLPDFTLTQPGYNDGGQRTVSGGPRHSPRDSRLRRRIMQLHSHRDGSK